MIKEMIEEVETSVLELIQKAEDTNFLSCLLLVAKGNMDLSGTLYTVDNIWDSLRWKTQEKFYIRYLNKNYGNEGFEYQGEEGIDDLSIEMMIYSHIWASNDFLKTLYRFGEILNGQSYSWDINVDDGKFGKKDWMEQNVIIPFENNSLKIAHILREAFSTPIRNAFAHALYDINAYTRNITIYPQTGYYTLSFSDFQQKFLYSALLINRLHNSMMVLHDHYGAMNGCLTEPFRLPKGIKCQLYAKPTKRGNEWYPEFRLIPVS